MAVVMSRTLLIEIAVCIAIATSVGVAFSVRAHLWPDLEPAGLDHLKP